MSSMRSTSSRTNISTFDEVDLAAAEEVFETAGGGDDEARAAVELVELGVLGEAAADEHGIVLRAGDELPVGLEDLHGELARGQQDERADGAALALGAGRRRSRPCARSSGSRKLRVLPVPVEAVARMSLPSSAGGMALGLNRRRSDEAGVGEAVLQGVGDVEVGEADVAERERPSGSRLRGWAGRVGGCGSGYRCGSKVAEFKIIPFECSGFGGGYRAA